MIEQMNLETFKLQFLSEFSARNDVYYVMSNALRDMRIKMPPDGGLMLGSYDFIKDKLNTKQDCLLNRKHPDKNVRLFCNSVIRGKLGGREYMVEIVNDEKRK